MIFVIGFLIPASIALYVAYMSWRDAHDIVTDPAKQINPASDREFARRYMEIAWMAGLLVVVCVVLSAVTLYVEVLR